MQLSPTDDQPKLKDVIQKLVEFATALAITIAKVDSLAPQGLHLQSSPVPASSMPGRRPMIPPLISHLAWPPLTRSRVGRISLNSGGGQSCIAGTRAPQNTGQGGGGSKSSDPVNHPTHSPWISTLDQDTNVKLISISAFTHNPASHFLSPS